MSLPSLRRIREEKGFTQARLAEVSGLNSQSTICKLENGKAHGKAEVLRKLAAVLDVTVDELLKDSD